jgi:hypothetical protein
MVQNFSNLYLVSIFYQIKNKQKLMNVTEPSHGENRDRAEATHQGVTQLLNRRNRGHIEALRRVVI